MKWKERCHDQNSCLLQLLRRVYQFYLMMLWTVLVIQLLVVFWEHKPDSLSRPSVTNRTNVCPSLSETSPALGLCQTPLCAKDDSTQAVIWCRKTDGCRCQWAVWAIFTEIESKREKETVCMIWWRTSTWSLSYLLRYKIPTSEVSTRMSISSSAVGGFVD